MLCCFGDRGETRGNFENPVSIATSKNGNLYVLDNARGTVQIFEATAFINQVHSVIRDFEDGDYLKAQETVNSILEHNETYVFAYQQLGKIYYKSGDHEKSMAYYLKAKDYSGHAKVFGDFRMNIYAAHFLVFAVLVIILIVIIIIVFKKINRAAKKIALEGIHKAGGDSE